MDKRSSSPIDRAQKSIDLGYQIPDENAVGILGVGILALAIGFGVFMGSWWLFNHFKSSIAEERPSSFAFISEENAPPRRGDGSFVPPSIPPPRLQLNPQLDLQKMLKKDHETLSTFGQGRIPIQDAINLLVEESRKKGTLKK